MKHLQNANSFKITLLIKIVLCEALRETFVLYQKGAWILLELGRHSLLTKCNTVIYLQRKK